MTDLYNWTDNATEDGIAQCLPDVLNENLMHLKYDNSGGVSKFSNLGTVTTNVTLAENVITTGHWSGTSTITLPTVTDTEKQVICVLDFITDSTGYPIINKVKNLTGTVAVTNGSATVTGTGTAFFTELQVGDKLVISSVAYKVSTIVSNTSLTLTTIYGGTTASGLTIGRNFLRWSKNNQGKAPSAYVTYQGIRNKLEFKTIWENGLLYWETEYDILGATEVSYTRPNLTSNGVFGNNTTMAVRTNKTESNALYLGFDSSGSTFAYLVGGTVTTGNIDMSFPQPTKIPQFAYTGYDSPEVITGGSIYASNDDVTYFLLNNFTSAIVGANATFDVNASNQGFYQFYRIYYSGMTGPYGPEFYNLTFNNATCLTVQ